MGQIQLMCLSATGKYSLSRASELAEWPYLLIAKLLKPRQAFNLHQGPVFLKTKPVPWDTWKDFAYSAPPPPVMGASRQMMVVRANDPFPIAPSGPLKAEEKVQISKLQAQEVLKVARNKASRADAGLGAQKNAYMIASLAFAFFALLIGIIVIQKVWGG
jgi:hypothetical protein